MKAKIFVGRENELEFFRRTLDKLVKQSNNREPYANTILVCGVGGMGKSSLCAKFVDIVKAEYPDVVQINVDWDRYKHGCTFSPSELLDILCDEIPDEFSKDIKLYLDVKKDIKKVEEEIIRLLDESEKFMDAVGKAAPTVTTAIGGQPEVGMAISAGVSVVGKTLQKFQEKYLKEKRGVSDEKLLLYNNPESVLAIRLREALTSITTKKKKRILIVLDTCELIRQSEEWFVDHFLVPLTDGNPNVILVFSGRDNIRDDRIATVDGRTLPIRGIANKLRFHEPYCIDMKLFSKVDIETYLKEKMEQDVSEEIVESVQSFARGVPYAVDLLANALQHLGMESTIKDFKCDDFRKQLKQSSSNEEIIKTVAERFLIYCFQSEENKVDLFKIYTIAILQDTNPNILQKIWKVENPTETLRMLRGKYTFFISNEKLHDIVQEFLVEHILQTKSLREGVAKEIASFAFPFYQKIYQEICEKEPEWEDRFREPQWKNAVLSLMNILTWKDPSEASEFFVKRGIELLILNDSFVHTLKKPLDKLIGMELIRRKHLHQINALMEAVESYKWYSFSEKTLSFCNKVNEEWELEPLHRSIINILKARMQYNQKEYDFALDTLFNQCDDTLLDSSLKKKLAEALDDVGCKFCLDTENYFFFSEKALKAFEKVVQLNNRKGSYLYHLAVMLRQGGQPEKALPYYSKSLGIDPKDKCALLSQGKAFSDLGRFEDAIKSYQRAIEIDPKYCFARGDLGDVYYKLGQFDDAIIAQQKAIDIDPKYTSPYRSLGYIYSDLGQYDDAIEIYHKAIEIDPKDNYVRSSLAFIYIDLEEFSKAEAICKSMKESDPDNSLLFNTIGSIESAKGDYIKAIECYKRVIEMEKPGYLGASYNNMGQVYVSLKQYEKSIECFERAIENHSTHGHSGLGYAYLIIGDLDKAEYVLLKAIRMRQSNTEPFKNLAITYLHQEKFKEAEGYFNEVIKMCSILKSIDSQFHNVTALGGLQKYEEALELLKQIINKFPIGSVRVKDFMIDLELLANAPQPHEGIKAFLEQVRDKWGQASN